LKLRDLVAQVGDTSPQCLLRGLVARLLCEMRQRVDLARQQTSTSEQFIQSFPVLALYDIAYLLEQLIHRFDRGR